MKSDLFSFSDKLSGSRYASQIMAALIVGASIAAFLLVASLGVPGSAAELAASSSSFR